VTIHLEIVSQERLVFEDHDVDMVVIPAAEGQMGVLPRHAPVLTTLDFGELVVRKGNAEERFAIFGGVVDVRPGRVVVLADMAESSFEIDSAAAEAARERAEKLLQEGVDSPENRQAALELRRANLELKISRSMQQRSPVMRIVERDDDDES